MKDNKQFGGSTAYTSVAIKKICLVLLSLLRDDPGTVAATDPHQGLNLKKALL
jgi:hypothetical protein